MTGEQSPQNPSAFPFVEPITVRVADPGMTLRDWFAGRALVGLLASATFSNSGDGFEDFIALRAFDIADAMLRARLESEAAR